MHSNRRRLTFALAGAAASALVLAGCAGTGAGTDAGASAGDEGIQIVTSTNVYASIAEAVGGDLVQATALIDSAAQDPHEYEATARDQLIVSHADLIIENGGGYDAFVDSLIASSGTDASVLTAVEFSSAWTGDAAHDDSDGADDHGHDHVEGFNEHVWYDPHAMADLALGIAAQLEALRPADAAAFEANAQAFVAEVAGLDDSLAAIRDAHAGESAFLTEPVSAYLVAEAGLEDVTPSAFSLAVEGGRDVAPASLLEALTLIGSGDVAVLIANAQTGGAETTQVIGAAEDGGIPILEFTETLPEGQTYLSWMQANISALAQALDS